MINEGYEVKDNPEILGAERLEIWDQDTYQ